MKTDTSTLIFSRLAGGILLASSLAASAALDGPTTVISQSPVGYWRLNDTGTVVPEPQAANTGSLGSPANGTYIETVRGVAGIPGAGANTAAYFPGLVDGNRVRVPYLAALNGSGAFTVEFWAKPDQTNALACPAGSVEFFASGQRNGWLVYQSNPSSGNGQGWLFRLYRGPALNSATTLTTPTMALDSNQWYHVVGVYDGANVFLYTNGVLSASAALGTNSFTFRPNTNTAIPLSFGARGDGGSGYFTYKGSIDEPAFYTSALSASQVLAHYQAGTNALAASYSTTVAADSPIGYWRLGEGAASTSPNSGSLGAVANATYLYNAQPGQPGPVSPTFAGFEAANKAPTFDGVSGNVQIPALNLATNAVTFTAWVKPNGVQLPNAGIVFSRQGNTTSGLKMASIGNFEVAYDWNNSAQNVPTFLNLADGQWNFIALIVDPVKAVVCLHDGFAFQTFTNNAVNLNQNFEGKTLIGQYSGVNSNVVFNGQVDEVAIFKRTLSLGEVYSQYAAGLGNLPPVVLADPVAPALLYATEPLVLTVDAGGTPGLSYQWRKNTSPIGGATSSVYSIPSVVAGDAGNYDVVITNEFGTVTSLPAAVTVTALSAPSISQDPIGRTIYQGGSVTLSNVASGGALKYQWTQFGTNLPGATGSSLTISNATAANAGPYAVVVSNALPATAVSASATVTVIVPAAGTFEAAIVADIPQAWWRLDEASGTFMTDGMGRHDGSYDSAVTLGVPGVVTGSPNRAARFPGTGSGQGLARVPYSPLLNQSIYSIEAWIKTADTYNSQAALSSASINSSSSPYQGRGYSIMTSAFSDGYWYASYGRNDQYVSTVVGLGPIVPNTWTHLVMTFSSSAGQVFYINGTRVPSSGGYADFIRNSTADFLLGGRLPGTGVEDYFAGEIDEVAYYGKTLTQAQVQAHYQAALYGSSTPPSFNPQPLSQSVAVGTSISLSAGVGGSTPISLRWYKNGAPVANGTNATLNLGAATYATAGSYQLWATNSAGTAGSATAAITVYPAPTYAYATNGLVLHLKFDGSYSDSSGLGNNAVAGNSPTFVAGKIGPNAVSVNTEIANSFTNYVSIPNSTSLSFGAADSFSVSYWVKFTGTPDDLPMIGNAINSTYQRGWVFADSGGLLEWTLRDTNGTTAVINDPVAGSPAINNGVWHHILAAFDRTANQARTYVDGALVDTFPLAGLVGSLDTGNPITIGQDPTGTYEVDGAFQIDDVGIWRRALSTFEAQSIYVSGSAGKSFDDPAGAPITIALVPSGSGYQIVWQGGTLKESDTVDGTYTPVAGATPPSYSLTPSAAKKFYKVDNRP